eukprot:c6355_g1_i1.p1 GENE.c6355_g1_i1~~c6355_g1_i1.p1  ORF type:complete len:591 (-),score=117.85 c6355_g1_i1:299-2071(-)
MSTAAVVAATAVPLYQGASALFDSLEEVQFEVIKINHYGRKQPRTLKLTKAGIQNIKRSSVVTKQFTYNNVVNVRLASVDEVCISYDNDHDFTYKSPMAVKIAREISNRLLLRRCIAFEKIAIEYQRHMHSVVQENNRNSGVRNGFTNTVEMLRFKTENEAERISEVVSGWILSKTQPEGRTIAKFIRRFASEGKRLGPDRVMGEIRQFMDGILHYMLDKRTTAIREALGQYITTDRIQHVIEHTLQQAIILPLFDEIRALVRNETMRKRENILCVRFLSMRSIHQLGFGVSESTLSSSNWALAVQELQLINGCQIPSDMLKALMASARMVYMLYKHEHEEKNHQLMGADDFLPIFIFVIVQACVECPLFVADFMWGLTDPQTLSGEGGYYITVFQSAMHHLRMINVDAVADEAERLCRECRTVVESPKLSLVTSARYGAGGYPRPSGFVSLPQLADFDTPTRDRAVSNVHLPQNPNSAANFLSVASPTHHLPLPNPQDKPIGKTQSQNIGPHTDHFESNSLVNVPKIRRARSQPTFTNLPPKKPPRVKSTYVKSDSRSALRESMSGYDSDALSSSTLSFSSSVLPPDTN